MKHCTHIFFDLDHTLWDYDFNARKVLKDLYVHFGLENQISATVDGFISVFFKTNAQLWRHFNQGEVDRDGLRGVRFNRVLKACSGDNSSLAEKLSDYFIYHCPRQQKTIDDADLILHYLEGKYQLHIITNGFTDVQFIKLKSSGLDRYFNQVFTSDQVGFRKPSPEIFHYAMAQTQAQSEGSIMIGDNPIADIKGASEAGLHTILFNPHDRVRSVCQYQIRKLSDLMKLL